ncbi:MAG: Crp/Fnr family transcriptional regulator [Nitrosomonas sp.]|nr:Crp/Fnr family transcriptional regulator [Nitrosomonas sp.]MBP6075496.1 Crp/Fnr family transcriptional regulator [Nitrosomonas sp.]
MPTTPIISLERAIALLSNIKDFKDLSLADLEVVAKVCHWHRYKAREEIVRYHNDSNSVFMITQGEVRVNYYSMSGKEVILCDLSSGEIFGELTAIDGESRSASVAARTSALLASISSSDFQELIFTNRKIAMAILLRLTGHIRRLTQRVFELSTLDVRDRIHAELLRLAKKQAIVSNTTIISPSPARVDLANLVGTVRETVSKELTKLENEKVILRKNDHGELHILDVARLTEMVKSAYGSLY